MTSASRAPNSALLFADGNWPLGRAHLSTATLGQPWFKVREFERKYCFVLRFQVAGSHAGERSAQISGCLFSHNRCQRDKQYD